MFCSSRNTNVDKVMRQFNKLGHITGIPLITDDNIEEFLNKEVSLSKYLGKKQHGYWWLHVNGTLQRQGTNCHGLEPEAYFDNWTVVKWWHIRCELDWYRMNKEADTLKNGPLVPHMVA